ncbi:acyl-CoA desaturase [bacterium]|jgi:stearoyl-CoA desaturase (delta-9 desaturase)|nr:acyl-CoA desaturase [bacterium]MDB4640378.1 acyl-CoA desaturase [Pirellulaceae bacterium]
MSDSKTKRKIDWPAIYVVGGIHVLALFAVVPWLFSWTGLVLAIGGCYVFGTLGVNLGYHRLLTHRSFKCPLWVERFLSLLGVCCLEKTPGQFVATHRAHHQFADHDGDPHSPIETLFWGHMGWIFVENPQMTNTAAYERYAKDVFRDRFYMKLERNLLWLWVYGIHAVLFYLVGFGVGFLFPEATFMSAVQFGLSVFVWGVLVRTVLVWHITWSVNSIGHVWGYRNYETRDDSRNSFFVGLLSNGDGWHNNHHADQRAAAHGHKWWEIDVSYTTLQVMKIFGLASDLVPIGNRLKAVGMDDSVSAQSSSVVPASHLSTKKNESQKNESEAAV